MLWLHNDKKLSEHFRGGLRTKWRKFNVKKSAIFVVFALKQTITHFCTVLYSFKLQFFTTAFSTSCTVIEFSYFGAIECDL